MKPLETLASNLNRLREERGLTISGLAQRCGIAKSTLSSLESGQGNPTIETLWSIANALDTPFGTLVASDLVGDVKLGDKKTVVRLIERSRSSNGASIETYSMSIEKGHTKESAGHPPGVTEKVVVTSGPMLVGDMRSPKVLSTGEVYAFEADMPHVYGAINNATQAMVFVEYPADRLHGSELFSILDWPTSDVAWHGVRSIVERMCIEVSNGIAVRILRFRSSAEPAPAMVKKLRGVLLDNHANHADRYRWPVLMMVEADQDGPFLAVLPKRFTHAFQGKSNELGEVLQAKLALELAKMVESPLFDTEKHSFLDAGTTDSWILEALACEYALLNGCLRLPEQLKYMVQRSQNVERSSEDEAFSSRIQVDHYDAFELLHPAYARQVVAMARDIIAFVPEALIAPLNTIDVGTGPGIPLLMLQELLPGLRPLAVEPDPVAYACLELNTRGLAGITLHQGGFLELERSDEHIGLITSTGASHHFNTAFMLQKALHLLQPGGVFSIADEFLPPFNDIESRNQALVRHHASYILDVACMIEQCGQDAPDDADGQLYRNFRNYLVQALLHAQQGEVLQAVRLCRQLYSLARHAALEKDSGHAIGAYTRFFWLELQAMVAGFDYEVERKTHVRRFIELARATGFEVLAHRRIFATDGDDDRDGGTHVITLRRPLG